MLATLAADPIASLVDTAFVGHLGAAQLAGTLFSVMTCHKTCDFVRSMLRYYCAVKHNQKRHPFLSTLDALLPNLEFFINTFNSVA
jgi:hypothetical protein